MKLCNEQQLQSKVEENKIKKPAQKLIFRSYDEDFIQIKCNNGNLPNVNDDYNK